VTDAGQGSFAGTGAIGRYWQARCIGFEVRTAEGRKLGVVTRVACHPESRRVFALYVGSLHRADPVHVDPESVALVDPWQRLLIVEQADEEHAPSEAATVVQTLPVVAAGAAPSAWRRALPVGAAAGRRAGAMARSAGPPLYRSAVWLGTRAAYAAAFVLWLYGAVVFVVARPLARVALVSLVALWTALGRIGPPLRNWTKQAIGHARDLSARNSLSNR
jgi:hypothetical protein